MTRNLKVAFLGIITLLTLNNALQAQTTAKLTVDMLTHFKKVVAAAASATDKTSAQKAVNTISAELKKVDALTPLLAKSPKPTNAEMAIVADASAKMDTEMRKNFETMVRNLKNKEVRALIAPAMKQFDTKVKSGTAAMNKLFPVEKMRPLIKVAKAKINIK